MTDSIDQHARRHRGRHVSPAVFRPCVNGWGISIGLLAIVACLTHFFAPGQSSAVDIQLGSLAHAYYAIYGGAGLMILVGLIGRHDELDAVGLSLFIGGLSINIVALIATVGGIQAIPAIGAWFAYMVGATGRLLVVTRLIRPRPAPEPVVPLREAIRMAIDPGRDDPS